MFEQMNWVEYNIFKNEYEEPPDEYKDMTRIQLHKCYRIEWNNADTLKRKLRHETN